MTRAATTLGLVIGTFLGRAFLVKYIRNIDRRFNFDTATAMYSQYLAKVFTWWLLAIAIWKQFSKNAFIDSLSAMAFSESQILCCRSTDVKIAEL